MRRTTHNTNGFSHISWKTIIHLAVASLRFKRFRSFITLLGIAMGVGSIYLLLSFGAGLQNLVESQIVSNKTINTVDISSANSKIISLNANGVKQIKSIAHVSDVSGIHTLASQVTFEKSTTDTVVYGIDSVYLDSTNFSLSTGRLINLSNEDETIINRSLLELIGYSDEKLAIGKKLNVAITLPNNKTLDKELTIVGVIDSDGGSELFMPKSAFEQEETLQYATARAIIDDRGDIAEVRQQIESLGYETTSPVDTIEQINEVFRYLKLVLIALGSTGVLIAALGMINTLTVSLLERTREIALMMTLGARAKDMRRLFTTEAVILSLTGGVLGIVIATIVGFIINIVLNQLARGRGVDESFSIFATPPQLLLGTIALVIGIGLMVSYLPARRAARINPVVALRQE